jgi:hypothetical protein
VDNSNTAGSGDISDDGKSLDVHINDGFTVTAIIVKGGKDSNVYFFDPFVPGPADFVGLVAPNNASGGPAGISHWLVCGFDDNGPPPPDKSAVLTSEVHLDGTHAVLDNANPATAPANVHDQVLLTVSGVTTWSGTMTLNFYTNNNCHGQPADTEDFAWTQATTMPQDNLLPQGSLAAGEYSYQESIVFAGENDDLNTTGDCEPFKVVDAPPPTETPTPSESSSLAVTGNTVGGVGVGTIAAAGVALIAVGAALVFYRRRRSATEGS